LINDCGTTGDILVYNIGFERGKLNDLIKIFQSTDEINNIIGRLKDLMIPFQKKMVLHPTMKAVTQLNMYYQHWFQSSHTKI
jgi:hypothetical protein